MLDICGVNGFYQSIFRETCVQRSTWPWRAAFCWPFTIPYGHGLSRSHSCYINKLVLFTAQETDINIGGGGGGPRSNGELKGEQIPVYCRGLI